MTTTNSSRVGRRAATMAAGAGTLAFTGAILAAGLGGGDARADALCDQMRAQYGPSWPCISVPTYTPPPTMNAPTTTPGAPGTSNGGAVIGGDTGPGPGTGNGTPIVGGTSSRPEHIETPRRSMVVPFTPKAAQQDASRETGANPLRRVSESIRTPHSAPKREVSDEQLSAQASDAGALVPTFVWALAGAAAFVVVRPRGKVGLGNFGKRDVAEGPMPPDFDIATKYIYLEMMHNLESEPFKDMKGLMDMPSDALETTALAKWALMVQSGGEWDHKPKLWKLLGMETVEDSYLPVPGTEYRVSYDIFSNVHYGYIGRAIGFSRHQLITGANLNDGVTGVNDPGDDMSMTLGMDLWDTYGSSMTYDQFHAAMVLLVHQMANAQKDGQEITQIRPK
ncbi:polymorphic toxin type 44 domain-containing protein [Gordonia malaquae]|uniref:polymorphic toxin type 44 domain-containing protein n=1 Tax=Gordonia malaquae TaxID=410332 RepID=UPI0030C79755